MSAMRISKGLDIPISGCIESTTIADGPPATRVALMPRDYPGIKVKTLVKEGDAVGRGQPLFLDRRDENVFYTSPANGTVEAINRGARRKILSIVVKIGEEANAAVFDKLDPDSASREQVKTLLAKSGLWPSIRRRPFNTVAHFDETPHSLFITAMDTNPLAGTARDVLKGREKDFVAGMKLLAKLPDGPTYLCTRENEDSPAFAQVEGIKQQAFGGPHPVGNVGVHIYALDPVGSDKFVWHIGYQDVAAVGALALSGTLPEERVVAVAGSAAKHRRLVRTRRGACLSDILADYVAKEPARVISGSVLWGNTSKPETPEGYLGAYSNQISIIEDKSPREFLGWALPGMKKYSLTNSVVGKFLHKTFDFNTNNNGGLRAIVPIGVYEKVMPMDIMPTFLLKALAADDIESAEKLGALELAEEDMALMEFVCPSKIAVTSLLRKMLTRMEKEG